MPDIQPIKQASYERDDDNAGGDGGQHPMLPQSLGQ
jgi:hypothetical protein